MKKPSHIYDKDGFKVPPTAHSHWRVIIGRILFDHENYTVVGGGIRCKHRMPRSQRREYKQVRISAQRAANQQKRMHRIHNKNTKTN